jgi:hypothetical protein
VRMSVPTLYKHIILAVEADNRRKQGPPHLQYLRITFRNATKRFLTHAGVMGG